MRDLNYITTFYQVAEQLSRKLGQQSGQHATWQYIQYAQCIMP
jgi:hypothetical protein